jgi:hypothetical protein
MINTRSPFFINVDEVNLTSSRLNLYIYTGTKITDRGNITYQLNSTAVSNKISFEISELIDDFINVEFDGNYKGEVVWVDYQIQNTINGVEGSFGSIVSNSAVGGYNTFEEGGNINENGLMITNDLIIKYDDNALVLPVNVNVAKNITMLYDGSQVSSEALSTTSESDEVIQYVSNTGLDITSYIDYVEEQGGMFEDNQCIKNFIADYPTMPVDRVIIEDIDGSIRVVKVRDIGECLYDVKKLTFVNKHGVLQDFWCFKATQTSIRVTEEKFNANIINNGTYNTCKHQTSILNKTAQKSLILTTGFVDERYNEVIEELLMSKQVWITEGTRVMPVLIANSSFNFKTKLDDKLINYRFNINYAHELLNNVR